MKTKKLVALATALTMVLTPMTAFAADLSIGGDVNYVETTIYKVTLPTTEGMNFVLDPQGLTSLDGEDATYDENEVGKIVGNVNMVTKNDSSVEVKLNAEFYLTDTADSAATLVDGSADGFTFTDATVNSIALVVTAVDNAESPTTTKIPVTASDDSGSGQDFTMAAAIYEFVKDAETGEYEYVLKETGSTLTMTIGGYVAAEADWSAYTGADAAELTLHAIFTFTGEDDEEVTPEEETPVVEDREPSIPSSATYDASEGTGTIAIDLGAGTTVTTVDSAYYGGTAENATIELEYEFDGEGNLTYSLAAWNTQAGKTKYVKVVLADGTEQVVTVSIVE